MSRYLSRSGVRGFGHDKGLNHLSSSEFLFTNYES